MAGLGFGLGVPSYPSPNILFGRNVKIISVEYHDWGLNFGLFTLFI
jgi:hypothetical protein